MESQSPLEWLLVLECRLESASESVCQLVSRWRWQSELASGCRLGSVLKLASGLKLALALKLALPLELESALELD